MQKSIDLVRQLVNDFKTHEATYLASDYQEQEARKDFIDKFLIALGWDVNHERQKNPYEQEVKIEQSVKTGKSQRRADYAFFIGPNFRDPKFFVEAKKPSRSLSNPDDYYQIIRYAYNKKIPISVLTDFEEFHIIDCRFLPDIKTALSRKIEDFHYTDYADEEKFNRIFHLFGREAVEKGSIEKYAAELPKPKGKGAQQALFKGGFLSIDEAFLEKLDDFRLTLAKSFKKHNQELESEELTEAVQRTIDRLVFIRFLEDKGIEERVIEKLAAEPPAWKGFVNLCRSLEPKYNGLVFKHHALIDGDKFVPPEEEFAEICNELSDPSSPYLFDEIPISILGSIYERFLGKVVHATPKRADVEDKPEVRKAGGVYYTPEYIVRYIVQNTVGKLLRGKGSGGSLSPVEGSPDNSFGKTPEEISQMAFADIACGSGSFLIEVYSELLDYHTRYYSANPEKAKPGDTQMREGKVVLSLKKRQEILTNNIYGVDIDYQATEVTQLSLYLKLLEDVTMNDAYQFGLLKEKILPDLKNNIKCGNSLIGTDILEGDLFEKTEERKLNPMNFADAFPKVMKRGGFDAIVGNPPYVRQETLGNIFKDYAKKKFLTYVGTADLYIYFIEQGHKILMSNGLYGIIVANKWMRSSYGKPLREYLKKNISIRMIVDFGELPVFQNAATFPSIIFTSNTKTEAHQFTFAPIKSLEFRILEEEISKVGKLLTNKSIDGDSWTLANSEEVDILKKLTASGIPLGQYVKNNIYRGILTGLNDAFIVDEDFRNKAIETNPKSESIIKEFVIGDDVRKYHANFRKRYLILFPNGWTRKMFGKSKDAWRELKKNYSFIADHLRKYEKEAINRWDKGEFWWELRPCDYLDEFQKTKIVYPEIAMESRFTLDSKGYFLNKTCFFIPVSDLYLLGILNSKCAWVFLKNTCSVLGDANKKGRLLCQTIYVEQLPIRTINFSDPSDKSRHDHIVKLVEQMLSAKEKLASAKLESEKDRLELLCSSLDRQIDEAVYELYGLTAEEIKVVEGE